MNGTMFNADERGGRALPDPAVRLLTMLKATGYSFITTTPATHRRVVSRPTNDMARNLRDVFGWSLPFSENLLPNDLLMALEAAGGLRQDERGFRSAYRASSLNEDLVLHSAFPPTADDAVFFGPDTYRFARFLRKVVGSNTIRRLVDLGSGSGAGAISVARSARVDAMVLTDINAAALALAASNLAAAGLSADYRLGDGLVAVTEPADLIIANPPFIAGDGGRTYRDGGDMIGAKLSLDWSLAAAAKLTPGGRFILYTGSAIVGGVDGFHQALSERLDPSAHAMSYEELDPDIFGGQLSARGYEQVERIAAVGAVITRRR